MVEVAPQFEQKDNLGTTFISVSTVGTSAVQIPASAGNDISDFILRCNVDNSPITKRLLWSYDNINYFTLAPGESAFRAPRQGIKQIYIKGSIASVSYEFECNREP